MGGYKMIDKMNEDIVAYKVVQSDWVALSYCFEKVLRDCFDRCVKSSKEDRLTSVEQTCLKNCYVSRLQDLTFLNDLILSSLERKI